MPSAAREVILTEPVRLEASRAGLRATNMFGPGFPDLH